MGPRLASVALAVCALALGGAARAQDATSQERQAARALADKGLELFEAGQFAEAYDRFKRAELVIHAVPHLLYMARAQAKLGKLVEAQRLYAEIAAEKIGPEAPKVFKQAQESAKSEGGALAGRIPKLVVVMPAERVATAKVSVDGVVVDAGASGSPIPVDPGERRVRVEEPGRALVRTVVAKEGATERIEIDAPSDEPAVPVVPPAPGPDEPESAGSASTVPAIVAFAVGGAGLAVGGLTGLLAFLKAGELTDACPKNPCSREHEDLADSSRTFGTISTVGFIVGGVGIAAGATILVVKPFDSKPEASVAVHASPGWLGVGGAW